MATTGRPVYFRPDSPSNGGGGGNFDPWEYDRDLAKIFKLALKKNIPELGTQEDQNTLINLAEKMQERLQVVGSTLDLLAPELRDLASEFIKLPTIHARTNPRMLSMRYRNIDLGF